MEIDIVGHSIVTQIPLYAECKFCETALDSAKLQAFFGKYTALWLRDKRCQGLFLAVPGVNPHAKAFYDDNLANEKEMIVRLVDEDEVLRSIFDARLACRPEVPRQRVPFSAGKPGDWLLVYTEKGFFFVFFVLPAGSVIPQKVAIFGYDGESVYGEETIEYLRSLDPELVSLEVIQPGTPSGPAIHARKSDPEEIVEVQGSSSCFEYQFPASPQFFVGRDEVFNQLESFVAEIIDRRTSARGVLLEANSGFGKSSAILSAVARLNASGNFAVSIDCRSASSPQFALRAVSHVLERYDAAGVAPERCEGPEVLGLESAARLLIQLGERFTPRGSVLFVFFDQIENLFFLPDALRPIRDLFLKVGGGQTRRSIGFSWKTDLFGITTEFPYQMRDAIAEGSRRIPLGAFSEPEAAEMLQRLSDEIRSKLRKDLRFFLIGVFSRLPLATQKNFAHVKQAKRGRCPTSRNPGSLLNVEQLFQEDLKGLSPEQKTLRGGSPSLRPLASRSMESAQARGFAEPRKR